MALILAIESDKRQVNYLTAMVRGKLHAELVLGDTAEGALDRLGERVPDLILTSALLSPRDEQALSDRLRRLNGVAAHVQMLTLPVFAPPARQSAPRGGVLSALLGDRSQPAAPDGCDPAVFAEQCKEYLRRAADEREARRHDDSLEPVSIDALEPASASAFEPVLLDAAADFAAELAHDQATERRAEPVADEIVEPFTEPITEQVTEQITEQVAASNAVSTDVSNDTATLDIDLSSLLEDVQPEQPEPVATLTAAADEEPAVYELSADALDMEAAVELTAPLAVAASLEAPAEAAAPADDFNEWQNVIDALKRESAQVRVPRARKTPPRAVPASAPTPAPAAPVPMPKAASEPPRRRRATRSEWRTFDPAQAGMSALYERLRQLERDDDRN